MSKKIYDDSNMSITSFFGGTKRGRCLQFTVDDKYVEYIEEQVKQIMYIIDAWLHKEM